MKMYSSEIQDSLENNTLLLLTLQTFLHKLMSEAYSEPQFLIVTKIRNQNAICMWIMTEYETHSSPQTCRTLCTDINNVDQEQCITPDENINIYRWIQRVQRGVKKYSNRGKWKWRIPRRGSFNVNIPSLLFSPKWVRFKHMSRYKSQTKICSLFTLHGPRTAERESEDNIAHLLTDIDDVCRVHKQK